ncbi:MAG: YceI family protein [Pedobacter sp.]|nr:MAG: YceI family protein [Pedobacter sp.]
MKNISQLTRLSGIRRYLTLMLLMPMICVADLNAQSPYKLSNTKENLIRVSGKSNVHDWSMNALNPTSEADFGSFDAEDNVPKTLTALSFSVNARNLKSEHASMDTRTYKVIKADANPKISFKLANAVITPVSKHKFTVKGTGALTIAGVVKTITMQVNGEVKADQSITCSGTQSIKLTDYGMEPPSFMLGAMKVGNELMISFTLNFKK